MKKIFALVSSFALIAVLLTGCGSKDDSSKKDVLTIAVDKGYVEYFTEIGKAFTEETGIELKVQQADMLEVLEALPTQQGNSADLFMAPHDRIGALVDQKLLKDLSVDLSNYSQTAQDAVVYDGMNYVLPLSIETTLFIYNKDIIAEAPKSLKELGAEDFASIYTNFYYAYGMFAQEGGYVFGADTTDVGLNNDGSIAAGKLIQSYYNSGVDHWELMKDDSIAGDIAKQGFKDGEIGAIIDGPWTLAEFNDAGVNYGISAIPSYDGTKTYKPFVGVKGLAINGYSKKTDDASKFVEFVAKGENAIAWHEATAEVSPHADAVAIYEAGSIEEVITTATNNGEPMPNNSDMTFVWESMADALRQIASGADVKEALDAAVLNIEQKIAE